jgi:hypothetical protein
MIELHLCKRIERLPKVGKAPLGGAVQYFCTVCHKFVKARLVIAAEPEKESADCPLEIRRAEMRGVPCGHGTGNIYVSNKRNMNRFGKSGSY